MQTGILISQFNPEQLEDCVKKWLREVLSEQQQDKPDITPLTTDQVCEEFKISRVTIHNYKKSGRLVPYSKAGKQHTYRRCDCQIAFSKPISAI